MTALVLDGLSLTLSIIGGIAAVLVIAGGVYAIFTTSRKDVTEKRLRAENEDLVRRLDWIEPRFKDAEAKNELLTTLHNPTVQLQEMSERERDNHTTTVRLLGEQRDILVSIENKLDRSQP